jgi:hypothetical protein
MLISANLNESMALLFQPMIRALDLRRIWEHILSLQGINQSKERTSGNC